MKKWILVVDDDPDIRECLVGILDENGYQVVEAENGQQALDRIADRGAPCVVVLDLMMPVMDGATFLERVEQSPQLRGALEVIVATAAAAGEREAVRRFSVVRGVLAKPFELDDLLKAVSGCANLSATGST